MDPTDVDTGSLLKQQLETERAQRELAEKAVEPEETAQHARRADKAHYLREKLEERARSETSEHGPVEPKP